MKSVQQQFELRNIQRGRRAAAEVDRRGKAALRSAVAPYQFAQQRFTKSRGLRAVQQVLVKRAVRTNSRSEGDVNIDVTDHLISWRHAYRVRGSVSVDTAASTGSQL